MELAILITENKQICFTDDFYKSVQEGISEFYKQYEADGWTVGEVSSANFARKSDVKKFVFDQLCAFYDVELRGEKITHAGGD